MADRPPAAAPGSRSASIHMLEQRGASRRMIARKAFIYTPLAVVFGAISGAALYSAFTSSLGALVGAVIFGLPAFAFAYEAVTAFRDLRAQPTITRGTIARMWNKGTILWMTRAYYLLLDLPTPAGRERKQRFFVISQEAYLQLDEGRAIEVEHWPYTNAVVSLGVVESSRSARGTTQQR